MEIFSIKLTNLRNEEHFKFHTDVKELLIRENPATLGVDKIFPSYIGFITKEEEALDQIRKSDFTRILTEADRSRDSIFSGLGGTVKSARNHFNSEVVDAATKLQIVFDNYDNVAAKGYNEETVALQKLVSDLKGTYSADVQTLGVGDWVAELELKNLDFDALKKERNSEAAGKTQLKMKEMRIKVDTDYRSIAKRINALIEVNGESGYSKFVNELNVCIESYNMIIAQRKGRNSKN